MIEPLGRAALRLASGIDASAATEAASLASAARPRSPKTQGKIEAWHETLKTRIFLKDDFLPGSLDVQISASVEHDNRRRYPESRDTTPPADADVGSAKAIIKQQERIKCQTIQHRHLQNRTITASHEQQEERDTPLIQNAF